MEAQFVAYVRPIRLLAAQTRKNEGSLLRQFIRRIKGKNEGTKKNLESETWSCLVTRMVGVRVRLISLSPYCTFLSLLFRSSLSVISILIHISTQISIQCHPLIFNPFHFCSKYNNSRSIRLKTYLNHHQFFSKKY